MGQFINSENQFRKQSMNVENRTIFEDDNFIGDRKMFVRTQFETIVNLAKFDKIKIEWHVKQDSGNVLHIISAVSEEMIQRTSVNEYPTKVSKSETLAQFPEDKGDQAHDAYIDLFTNLLQGETAFDLIVD